MGDAGDRGDGGDDGGVIERVAPDAAAIRAAARRLEGIAVRTPLLENPLVNALAGRRVLLKAECLQRTGSFKFRGAWNALAALRERARRDGVPAGGVIAYSSGNHAQGVALAARELGLAALVVMPDDAPAIKLANTRALGAEVVTYDRQGGASRERLGERLARERGLTLVRPYDEPAVIAGQGTCGLEIADQARAAGVEEADVLVCCGGGGLASGIALALEAEAPGLRVRTVEPAAADDTARSLRAGTRLAVEGVPDTICDAIVTPMPGELTFPVLARLAGAGLAVDDRAVLGAMRVALERFRVVLEPGGAVALAAALAGLDLEEAADGCVPEARSAAGHVATRPPVVCVASGGNVDPALLVRALRGESDAEA